MRIHTILPTFALILSLGACGETRPAPSVRADDVAGPGLSAIAGERLASSGQGGRAGLVTSIDAAIGDGSAMPQDAYGPSRYDLALATADRDDSASVAIAARPPVARPAISIGGDASAEDLLRSDDAVTSGG